MRKYHIPVVGNEIAIYESVGKGQPILLLHGNSASGLTFSEQLDGELGRKQHVVAIDLPGHGSSGRPHDPRSTYSLPGLARVVTGVIEALDLQRPILVGWSLGGHIVMEAAPLLPDAAGFAIYGAPPVGKPPAMDRAFGAHPGIGAIFAADADPELVESLIQAYFSRASPHSVRDLVAMWKQTDPNARALLGRSLGAGNYSDELEVVDALSRPIAVLQGDHERLVRRDYLESIRIPTLWREAIQIVPHAAHAIHAENPEEFNRYLSYFVDEVSAEQRQTAPHPEK